MCGSLFPDCYDSARRADFRVFLADLQCDFSSAEYVRSQRILNYTVKQQLIDILPATLFSAVMAACVKCVTQLLNGAFVSLVAGIATGVAVYLLLCMLFRVPEIKQLKNKLFKRKHA